jgi:hypothetical protein
VRGHERAQRRGQVLGLARGRGDREHEPAGTTRGPGRESSRDQRAQCLRRDKVTLAGLRSAGLDVECGTELGIFGYGGQ